MDYGGPKSTSSRILFNCNSERKYLPEMSGRTFRSLLVKSRRTVREPLRYLRVGPVALARNALVTCVRWLGSSRASSLAHGSKSVAALRAAITGLVWMGLRTCASWTRKITTISTTSIRLLLLPLPRTHYASFPRLPASWRRSTCQLLTASVSFGTRTAAPPLSRWPHAAFVRGSSRPSQKATPVLIPRPVR